jgi:hypothetical protein
MDALAAMQSAYAAAGSGEKAEQPSNHSMAVSPTS